ncbi:calcineurin-like phosphoesterase C-terminal domain-containing protein [Dysgonomonas termitidis]|uniref:Calcineurin-like phosphoesterase C-terminal domain-containing protein n=1 Tax=Dysgonomonas termitidis TaxID=1516126 RepID=A0ABV9KQT1_9BACT
MKIKGIVLLCLAGIFSFTIAAQQVKVSGIVFEDKNKNGVKDASEKGVKNILVSNGKEIVLTDKAGAYTINTSVGSSIFPIIPSQYGVWRKNKPQIQNTAFLYIDTSLTENENLDFDIPLIPLSEKKTFRVGAIGDIQMKDYQEINYANQSVISELLQRSDIDFNIFMGDQINETLDILPSVTQMIESLPMPSWLLLGNHDRNVRGTNRQDDVFNRYFGASYYAFNYGNVHFIVLNNVASKGGRDYTGLISDEQLCFIKNDLAYVSKDKTVVVCQHIPMVYTRNRNAFLDLVKDYPTVLILSGHTHQISRHILAPNVHELGVGASCGNWWIGERDWLGIPTALMQCGSPKNYFTIDFDKNNYKINYKGIGLSADRQMDIWIGGQDTVDTHIEALSQLDKNLVVANIYGGSDSTTVMMQIDAGDWIEMDKTSMVPPSVSRLIYMNNKGGYPASFSRKGALRKRESPHIWTVSLPTELSIGIHTIKIYAKDKYGFEVNGSRLFSKTNF